MLSVTTIKNLAWHSLSHVSCYRSLLALVTIEVETVPSWTNSVEAFVCIFIRLYSFKRLLKQPSSFLLSTRFRIGGFLFSIGHFGALQIAPQFDELSCVGKVDGALMVVHVIDRCCHFFIVFGRPDQCVLSVVFDREEVVEILRTTPNARQNNPWMCARVRDKIETIGRDSITTKSCSTM